MIDLQTLKESDVGRIVVYKAGHASHKPEKGVITSWNESFIFVDYYGTGRGTATKPVNLTWDKDDVLLNSLENEINQENSGNTDMSV